MDKQPEPTPEHDIVWGAKAIAKVINQSERMTFFWLENGKLPARKNGRRWAASRAKLVATITGEAM